MKAINLNPIMPVRTAPSEQSEQCTQLLFGELFDVKVVNSKWCSIVNDSDGYEGFVSKNMVTFISEVDYKELKNSQKILLSKPIAQVRDKGTNDTMYLPMGSTLYNFIEGDFSVFDRDYELIDTNVRAYSLNVLPEVALQLLNAPYLWGGKSVLGIDCSGFVQTVFAVCGKMLPRDASQQVAEGETICFLTEAKLGDLAFFENEEGDIVHVGLLLDNRRIIHASGSVKISLMDNYGILSPDGGYSHKLRIIKRIKC
jgi:hypothetical protein